MEAVVNKLGGMDGVAKLLSGQSRVVVDKHIIDLDASPLVPEGLNVNVLDYLLANPSLIPEEWKGKNVFFRGTIDRNSDGLLYGRCLHWFGSEWSSSLDWLVGSEVYVVSSALVLSASQN